MDNALHCYISGKVQGVGFRVATQRKAKELELNGWVKNLVDGRVEVMVNGSEVQLEAMRVWLKEGPSLARVDDLACQELHITLPPGFHIK
jgi:acylphosphatase